MSRNLTMWSTSLTSRDSHPTFHALFSSNPQVTWWNKTCLLHLAVFMPHRDGQCGHLINIWVTKEMCFGYWNLPYSLSPACCPSASWSRTGRQNVKHLYLRGQGLVEKNVFSSEAHGSKWKPVATSWLSDDFLYHFGPLSWPYLACLCIDVLCLRLVLP